MSSTQSCRHSEHSFIVAGSTLLVTLFALRRLKREWDRQTSLKYLRHPDDYERYAYAYGSPVSLAYFGFYATAARETMNACRKAFESIRLVPRSMQGVDSTCETTYFSRQTSMPLVIAPTALHQFADPEGEIAMARGAGQAGAIYCYNYFLSSQQLDQVAKTPGEKWLHLYIFKERHLVEFAIEECLEKYKGVFSAIIVTLDQ